MPLKTFFAALLAAAALWFLWQQQQPALAHAPQAPVPADSWVPVRMQSALHTATAQATAWLPRPAALPRNETVHKCQLDERVLYTDELCPSGFEELALSNGTFTVVPSLSGPPQPSPQVAMDRQRLAPEPSRWLE